MPQAPGIGDILVGTPDPALQCLFPLTQPLLHDGLGLAWIGRQAGGEFGLDPGRQVQLDDSLATHGLDRVMAVGDDQHIGCCERAEQGHARPRSHRDSHGFPRSKVRKKAIR